MVLHCKHAMSKETLLCSRPIYLIFLKFISYLKKFCIDLPVIKSITRTASLDVT